MREPMQVRSLTMAASSSQSPPTHWESGAISLSVRGAIVGEGVSGLYARQMVRNPWEAIDSITSEITRSFSLSSKTWGSPCSSRM